MGAVNFDCECRIDSAKILWILRRYAPQNDSALQ